MEEVYCILICAQENGKWYKVEIIVGMAIGKGLLKDVCAIEKKKRLD